MEELPSFTFLVLAGLLSLPTGLDYLMPFRTKPDILPSLGFSNFHPLLAGQGYVSNPSVDGGAHKGFGRTQRRVEVVGVQHSGVGPPQGRWMFHFLYWVSVGCTPTQTLPSRPRPPLAFLTILLKFVLMIPGARQFTLMFREDSSMAKFLVRPSKAVLLTL